MAFFSEKLTPAGRTIASGFETASGSYPSTTRFDRSLSPYDLIVIDRIAMPLAQPPEGGTEQEVDKQKGSGLDYESVVGKGYKAVPVKFVLLLFVDGLTGTDWIERYDSKIRDLLLPKKLDSRNAREIYHPCLSGDGISAVVITRRGSPKHVGKQIFHVDVEGIDLRVTRVGKTTKKMKQDSSLKSGGTVLGKDSPAVGQPPAGPAGARVGKK